MNARAQLPREISLATEPGVEMVKDVCRINFRGWTLKRGLYVPVHEHSYAHPTLISKGGASLWVKALDTDEWFHGGDYYENDIAELAALHSHAWIGIAEETTLWCIHDLNGEPYKTMRLKGEI